MANVWKEPIFDRTLEDVETAIQKITGWKRGHTHHVDIKVENDVLILESKGTAYVTDTEAVIQNEGAMYIEDGVVILDIDDVYDLKGCLNLADLNRIEGDIEYLAEKLENYYYPTHTYSKVWIAKDIPNQNDMSRIVYNIRSLIDSFYTLDNHPPLPNTMMRYDDINAIEENLHLMKEVLDCMQNSFKKSGTVKCGAKTLLPIRR